MNDKIYSPLPQETKDKWLKALRSGRYKQIEGRLGLRLDSKVVGYCCLGVLARVADQPNRWSGNALEVPGESAKNFKLSDICGTKNTGALPLWMEEALGLDAEAASVLVSMNDSGKHSFKDIANWIESNL